MSSSLKTIAKNANDFASIRTMDHGNCIYVDKTDFFHRLVTAPGENLFFIARPRRFGKSLMITTFKYVFEGRRDESAAKAIEQIHEKGYAKPYLADGRPVYLIGLNFDTRTRQLADAAWEEAK